MRPHVCHACRRGGAEHGPYFEADWHYADPRTGSECRLYVCKGCFGNYLFAQGSPFAAELAKRETLRLEAVAERDLADQASQELREALDEANARLAQREAQGLSAEALAAALEERWGTPPASWRERTGGRT